MSGGEAGYDLSGRWTGIFNYPEFYPPNSFEATLQDANGLISGTTVEREDDPSGSAVVLHAIVDGRRDGSSVSFIKVYDDADLAPEPILYHGIVQADGNEIHGDWTHPGQWSGTFIMIRASSAEEMVTRKESETV